MSGLPPKVKRELAILYCLVALAIIGIAYMAVAYVLPRLFEINLF